MAKTDTNQKTSGVYVWDSPEELPLRTHFSSLLLSGEWTATLAELSILSSITMAGAFGSPEVVNTPGSMSLLRLSALLWTIAVVRRFYNTWLEACYFAFPQYRTQPPREHSLTNRKDLTGRDLQQLNTIHFHDRLTMASQFALQLCLYYGLPGYFPRPDIPVGPLWERVARLVLNHYVLSFGMYWMHRSLHVVPFMWKYIHSYHHWARHPLSRNTYEDHWLDNFMNAIVGHVFGNILVPLDYSTFCFSQVFRVFESLEKHSGVSCWLNLAHQTQRIFPYSQMPHHHDWHHEGHKGSNFTFTSLGGVWDALFGTRWCGRSASAPSQMTGMDRQQAASGKQSKGGGFWDQGLNSLIPLVFVTAAVALKLTTR